MFQVCALLHIILASKNMPQTTKTNIRKTVKKKSGLCFLYVLDYVFVAKHREK